MPGYDAVLQAMGGLMSINGTPESGAVRIGIPIVDYVTGYNALTGILLALGARERTGRGQRVEATLFDTALSLLVPHAANWLCSGRTPGRLGSAHPNIAPYDKFAAGDGEIFLGIVNDGQFRRFCKQVEREDLLADPRFATNAARLEHAAALRGELERILAQADTKAVAAFAHHVKGAGASTRERIGMWAESEFANLVQPNDGFKTRLIGTASQITDRIRAYQAAGVDLILCGFLHFAEEAPVFGRSVIARFAAQPHSLAV